MARRWTTARVFRTGIASLSLLAGLCAALLWWNCHDTPYTLSEVALSNGRVSFVLDGGTFSVHWYTYCETTLPTKETWFVDFPAGANTAHRLRFMVESWSPDHASASEFPNAKSVRYIFFNSPVYNLWFLVALFSIYPVIAFVRGPFRRRRRRAGCCVECGYNLTRNVSGRCPECGSTVPTVVGNEPVRTPDARE